MKRKDLLSVIVLCLFCLSNPEEIFSQSRQSIPLFKPKADVRQEREAQRIKQWAEHYKKSHGLNNLYVYKAAVSNASTICRYSPDKNDCLFYMADLLELNNLAIGRCKNLGENYNEDFCTALKKGNCNNLGREGAIRGCEAFLNFEPQSLAMAVRISKGKIDMPYIIRSVAYYSVFKTGNVLTCLQLLKNDAYCYKIGCYMLLSPDPQGIIDKLALDFAHYYYADSQHKTAACANINDDYIRSYCETGIILSKFIDNYFLAK